MITCFHQGSKIKRACISAIQALFIVKYMLDAKAGPYT